MGSYTTNRSHRNWRSALAGLWPWVRRKVGNARPYVAIRAAVLRGDWLLTGRLDPLARLARTDKSSEWHGYTEYYERHLGPVRRSVTNVLEIGVGGTNSGEGYETESGGQSLHMWADYFPQAQILGVDINPKPIGADRIFFEQGDQSDPAFLARLASEYGPFDVVIDDGSHIGTHVITSFTHLWRSVKPGGWYVIEDLAVAYDPEYEGGPPGTPGTAVALLKSLIDDTVLRYRTRFRPEISAMHVYGGIAFLRKADRSLRIPPW